MDNDRDVSEAGEVNAQRLERESLRRQYDLLHEIRDRMRGEPADWYDEWQEALLELTDKIIHRLRELEGQPPYPHPISTRKEHPELFGPQPK